MAEVADEAIKLLKIMVFRNNNAISAFRYRIIDKSISGNRLVVQPKSTCRFYQCNVRFQETQRCVSINPTLGYSMTTMKAFRLQKHSA